MIFSRRTHRPRNCAPAIADFWRWWSQARGQVEKSIDGGGFDEKFVREITKRVHAIHRDLQWEFGRGVRTRHMLTVCAPGSPQTRSTIERWLAAAPPADATWAYHGSRQADLDRFASMLSIGGHDVDLEKMRFGVEVDKDRQELDVTAFHPIFSVMTDDEQLQVTFLALDFALGETDVELWVGAIDAGRTEPQRPHTAAQLRSVVINLSQKASDDRWAIRSGEDSRGHPVTATVRTLLKPARWPRFDTHLRVELPYSAARANGFPDEKALARLRSVEDSLVAALAGDGDLFAHETSAGRRLLHLYVDGLSTAPDVAKRLLHDYDDGKASLATTYDPHWTAIAHLRG